MRVIDVTLPISPRLPVWPGDPRPELLPVRSLARGDPFNLSALHLSTHTGTHVDAPRHLFAEGATVDQLPLETLVGRAWVCRLPETARVVTAELLEGAEIDQETQRLLLATASGALWRRSPRLWARGYVGLTPEAAEWIVARGTVLVGIDSPSVDPANAEELAAHRILLSHGVVLVEALDLRRAPEGSCEICCLPLRLVGSDGAPARVMLRTGVHPDPAEHKRTRP